MFIKWTQHLKEDKAKADFEKDIRNSYLVLGRLKDIIDEQAKSLERSEIDQKVFDIPNWDYKAASNIGYKAALAFVKKLIDLDHQTHKE